MRVPRVGLRLSLVATQRTPVLLCSAVRAGLNTPQPFAVRSLSASPAAFLSKPSPLRLQQANSETTKSETKSETTKPETAKSETATKAVEKSEPESKAVEKTGDEKKKKDEKLTIWQKVKKEAKHYWEGTKLLGYEVKISFKLALKLASGRELSRREDRQLKRTLQDIARLVPFSVFVLIPFAELLLPLALKLFPNLLPSTYESSSAKKAKSKKLGVTRTNVGDFLRSSMNPRQIVMPEFSTKEQQKEFEEFFRQIREGEKPSRTRLLTVARLFKDDMLLDNLSRPQLAAIAKYMGIQGFGTSIILRYQIRHKMRMIKQDDRVIDYEGVDSLNTLELQNACQSRGFKTIGVSAGRLREDLSNWLQLRLHDRVPSSLLILSSAFSYGSHDLESVYDGILSVLSSLPPEVYHETELEIQSNEASNAKRLEVLKEQDDLIREENLEEQESGHVVQVRDNLNVDDDEHTPKPTTESEADVKADQAWYEQADKEAAKRGNTTTTADATANAAASTAAASSSAAATTKASDGGAQISENATDSEESIKADQHFYEEADKKTQPQPQPTASEADVKADQDFYPVAEQQAWRSREKPTVSEQDVRADQAFYKDAAGDAAPTASEESSKADQHFYEAADTSREQSERATTDSEAAVKADNEFAKKSS